MSSSLLFDLDNTLVDRDAAMQAWARQWPVDEETRLRLLAIDASGQGCRLSLARALDASVPGDGAWTPSGIAGEIAEHIAPSEAVQALLRRLRERYRLALVSNGGTHQREKLRRAGLDAFFDVVCVSGELGVAKPAPEIFREALRALGARPADCTFVGDSLEHDIEGAAALGMRTVWVHPDARSHPSASCVVRSVLELEAQLSRLEAA